MTGPLITCGITAFDAEASIERAVLSALAQHYRPIEIVVVDDMSTDTTPAILARLAAGHQEIRVFRQVKNGGVAASRNRIIHEARGEFIAFFDDDDVSLPRRLSVQLGRILDYERKFAAGAPVICHAARIIKYRDGQTQIWRAMGELDSEPAPAGVAVARAILGAGPPPRGGQDGSAATCSQMARRAVYKSLGGFDSEFRRSEDSDFAVRASLAGAHFVGLPRPLVVQSLTATSDKSVPSQQYYGMKLLEKHRGFLEIDNSYSFARRYNAARYSFVAGRYGRFFMNAAASILMRPMTALRRFPMAVRNLGLNRRMGRFYMNKEE